jgi:D-alanine-D-alanine ligase
MKLDKLREADVVFPALHGGDGEDGHLQAVLDLMGVRYAMSGPQASAVAMDKAATKRIMRGAGIPTPDWLLADIDLKSPDVSVAELERKAHTELGYPMVVKPNADGSSVGVSIVEDADGFTAAFAALDQGHAQVLIESFIPGRELTSTILLGRRLPLVEITPGEGFYDYANKYTDGASHYTCPANVESPVYEKIGADARRLYDLLGCRGVARVDFRLDGDAYYCLEVNTIPGMTANSLVPKAAAVVGIDFATLLIDLCEEALARPV